MQFKYQTIALTFLEKEVQGLNQKQQIKEHLQLSVFGSKTHLFIQGFVGMIIQFFKKVMQNLGNQNSPSVNTPVITQQTQYKVKKVKSRAESPESNASKAKKITKIIHNTFLIYVDSEGQRKTVFQQKLRNRKSKENVVNMAKIKREAQEFNKRIQEQIHAPLMVQPQGLKQGTNVQMRMPYLPSHFYQFPFFNFPIS